MSYFNEHALELSIMELFQDEGYLYLQGDKIHRERSEVLLVDDLKQYLYNRYAKDGITTNEVESIVFSLRTISGTIYEANKTVYIRLAQRTWIFKRSFSCLYRGQQRKRQKRTLHSELRKEKAVSRRSEVFNA